MYAIIVLKFIIHFCIQLVSPFSFLSFFLFFFLVEDFRIFFFFLIDVLKFHGVIPTCGYFFIQRLNILGVF